MTICPLLSRTQTPVIFDIFKAQAMVTRQRGALCAVGAGLPPRPRHRQDRHRQDLARRLSRFAEVHRRPPRFRGQARRGVHSGEAFEGHRSRHRARGPPQRKRQGDRHDDGGRGRPHHVAGPVRTPLAALLGTEAIEDGGLQFEGELVVVEAVRVRGTEDLRQRHELVALVATRAATFGVGAERHPFAHRELAHDLHGDESPEVLAVGDHCSHPISSSASRRVRNP